jgi:hypothetical protein
VGNASDDASHKHDEKGYAPPTCPVRARWKTSFDEHAAIGNPTDPIQAAAGQAMISSCRFASTWFTSNHQKEHESMGYSFPGLSRRRFLGSTILFGMASKLLPKGSVQAESPRAVTPSVSTNSAQDTMSNSNDENGTKIVWTSANSRDGNMPYVNADGHPVFDNPHGWTTITASIVHWIIKPLPHRRQAVFFLLRLLLSLQNTAALLAPILSLNLVQRPGVVSHRFRAVLAGEKDPAKTACPSQRTHRSASIAAHPGPGPCPGPCPSVCVAPP